MKKSAHKGGILRLHTKRLEFVNVEGEVVVLDSKRSLYYAVNETGGQLWAALQAGTTEDELRRILVERHGLTEEKAATDITDFLDQLDEAGLLDHDTAP